jgi:hypothetical protein
LNFTIIVLVGVVGSLAADYAWFMAGRWGGFRVVRALCAFSANGQHSALRARTRFAQWGLPGLVFAKFIPGLDGLLPPLAGAMEIELKQVQKRVLDATPHPFSFRLTSQGREFLLEQGTDQRYGARHLKRAIERNVVCPLSRLLATGQVHQGDVLLIDRHRSDKGLVFLRDTEKRSCGPKIDFPLQDSGLLMSA